MQFFEIYGFPGSGKTSFLDSLHKNKKINKKLKNYEELFYNHLYQNSKLSISKIKFIFKRKLNKTDDIRFFLYNNYNNDQFKEKIDKNFNQFRANNRKLCEIFFELLKLSIHSKARKQRIKFYFKINAASFNLLKKLKKNNFFYYNDEGFKQKIFLNYKAQNKKKILKLLKEYLNLCPKTNNNLCIKKSFKECVKIAKSRKANFEYINDNLKSLESIYAFILDNISKINKKILIIEKYSNENKNIQKFKKKILSI